MQCMQSAIGLLLENLSVSPSNVGTASKRMDIVTLFDLLVVVGLSFSRTVVTKFQ